MVLFLQHIEIEGPGLLQELFEQNGFPCDMVRLQCGEKIPEITKDLDGVVILGGPMNVYEEDKYPFLKQETEFIYQLIEKKIPTFGICLGAQLMAKSMGASITQAPQEEMGWLPITLTDQAQKDHLFAGMQQQPEVFQWHQDRFAVPDGGILLAESAVCPQAFRVGLCAYGFQFHLEVTPKIIASWVNYYWSPEKIEEFGVQRLQRWCHPQDSSQVQQQSGIFLNQLVDIVQRRNY